MRTRSSTDIERLLRRTYADVADRTTVPRSGDVSYVDAPVGPVPSAAARRWRPLLAVAAVVALVVGGLAVLSGRGAITPSGRAVPRHVAPGSIPRLGIDELGRLFPLTDLVSTENYDRLKYAVDGASVTIEVFRDGVDLPAGDPRMVRGADGVRTSSGIHWLGPDGSVVAVSWNGTVEIEMIDDVIDGMVYLDDGQWEQLIAHGGFRAVDSTAIAGFSIPADERFGIDEAFEVELVGSLHDGISLRNGPNGFVLPLRQCAAQVDWNVARLRDRAVDEPGRIGYLVLAPGAVRSVRVSIDGTPTDVELTPLGTIADVSLGGIALDDRLPGDEQLAVDCEVDR